MRRFLWFCVLLGASVGVGAGEAAVPEKLAAAVAALPAEARPQEIRAARNGAVYALLPNGCEIIVKEKRNAPVVAVQAWVRTGAIHEGKSLGAGLSHFCEHMLFKGTTKFPPGALDQAIRGAGGDNNAYTSSERTVYHVTSAKEGFETALSALAAMVTDATFPPEETVKEHAVVYKEIERAQDNPDDLLWRTLESTVYQIHPYRVPVLGYPDAFKRVTREHVYGYYKERYGPQLTTFVAVGDFDAAAALSTMSKTLAPWPRTAAAPLALPEEPEQVAARRVRMSHPLCTVTKLMLAFPTIPLRDPDLYAVDVLASVLGDGRSSRLYRTVKDQQGLALEISAFSYTPEYRGYFAVTATLEDGKAEAAEAAILKVLEDAAAKRPSNEELQRAKRKAYTQYIQRQMTADGVAGMLGNDWQSAGDLDFAAEYVERIEQVTAEDVQRVARKYLVPQRLTSVLMTPPAQNETKPATRPQENSRHAALEKGLAALQQSPLAANARMLAEYATFEFTLKENGVRVVVREDHTLPVASVVLAALGGTRWEPAELAGAGNLLAEMLDRGTAKRGKLKIAAETENLGASLSTFSGRNAFGVTASGMKEDLGLLLDLASDCLLRPAFAKDELEKLKVETLEQIAQEDEELPTLNAKVLRPLLYGTHPYARQVLGTSETVKRVTADDLKRLHEAWVQPGSIAIGFVGDVTALEALDLAQRFFGGMKSRPSAENAVVSVPPLTQKKEAQQEKEGLTGAFLSLGFQGVGMKSADREALDFMASLLSGLGGRLYVALREKEGLAYDVGVYNDTQVDGGAIVFYIQTDTKSLEKALKGMWNEIGKLRTEPVAAKEMDSVKRYLLGMEAVALQDQSGLAQRLTLAQIYTEGAAHIFGRRERLAKLTPENVQAAAVKYLQPEKWATAVTKPK
jgi:zinc protease